MSKFSPPFILNIQKSKYRKENIMTIRQLSVFLENRHGTLVEVTELLAKENIDIRAMSLADTQDFGILRLIVNDPEAAKAIQSETTLESEAIVTEHQLPYYPVTLWLDFNDEEQAVMDMYRTGIQSYTQEMLTKFLLGQEPLSNFDKFVETLNSMGVDEVLGAYKSAYDRVK